MQEQQPQSLEQEQMATATVKVELDLQTEQYRFTLRDKAIEFAFIPLMLDARGGDRDPDYLIKTGEELGKLYLPGDPKTVQIRMPFICTPKGFFGDQRVVDAGLMNSPINDHEDKYTLIQGNTRYLGLRSIMAQNLELLKAAKAEGSPEAMQRFDQESVKIEDFGLSLLAPNECNYDYILWLQSAINDGVARHTASQNLKSVMSYIQFLKDKHAEWSMSQIREQVAKTKNMSLARVGQYITAAKFPDFIFAKIDEGLLVFDTAVKLVAAYNNKIKPIGISIASFFNECLTDVEPGVDQEFKITPTSLKKTVDRLSPKASTLPETDAEGTGEGNEGTGEGSGSGSETQGKDTDKREDPVLTMPLNQVRDGTEKLVDVVASALYNLLGMELTEKSQRELLRQLTAFESKITLESAEAKGNLVTVEVQKAKDELRAAEAAAKKAQNKKAPEQTQTIEQPTQELVQV